SCILGVMTCALCLPLVVLCDKEELSSSQVRVLINATSCSVTCGPGFKLEELCEMGTGGERWGCQLRRSRCLAPWACGLHHSTIPAGNPFQLSCLEPELRDTEDYLYTWRRARGLITTNDVLFQPFHNPGPIVEFSPTQESDAGTYRCDVQMLKTLKVIKRVYFGLRVTQKSLVDINFDKFLTLEQKLAANEELGSMDNST
ncbi:TMM81 protein, partial [Turnix velox]|nr:TMM81 protein [Turnix velox]